MKTTNLKLKFLSLIFISIFSLLLGVNQLKAVPTIEEAKKLREDFNSNKEEIKTQVEDNKTQIVDNLPDLESIKKIEIQLLRAIITGIEEIKQELVEYQVPSEYQCNLPQAEFDEIISYLESQISSIQATSNLNELRSIHQETIDYLQSHKQEIINYSIDYIDCAYRSSVTAIKLYLQAAQKAKPLVKAKGGDVDTLDADIIAAEDLLGQSENIYVLGDYDAMKQAFIYLGQTAPYLEEIAEIIGMS